MYSTHKIVGISTLSRAVHGTAQTREYACTKVVIPQVIARGMHVCVWCCEVRVLFTGLKIKEVAHDIQQQVSKYINRLGLVNYFDTWHGMRSILLCVLVSTNCICTIGTKNVRKEMKKISKGRVRDRDKTWFSQLADERELIRYGVLLLELFIIHVAKSIKLHLYWSMKNCGRNPALLRDLIN